MSIYRGAGGSGDATNDATVSQVQTYASQAATSATNAAASATAAAGSAAGAATSATLATAAKNDSVAISNTVAGYVASALASEAAASGSATDAAASAAAAAISEGGASGSASDALDSANTATTQATAASTSATNSANSAAAALAIYGDTTAMNTAVTSATNSATAAATSATNAATSATAAAGSASNAVTSASAASTSATAAATSAASANTSASNASGSASSASGSASTATTQASNASTSAAAASNSAANAATSAITASTQAGIATTGATTATTQAGIATTQAGIATTQATSATSSAITATTQAFNASTSATSAASSETNSLANRNAAATSATNASTSASAAATSATSSATSASAAATSAAAASAVALGNEPVRHSVRPSLLLDFANTKQLDPRITFTRASTATFYDGRTTAKAEENLLLQSQTFENATWLKYNTTSTENSTIAPDGTTTADTLTATAGNNIHHFQQNNTALISGSTYTLSAYVKAGTSNFVSLIFGFSSPTTAWTALTADLSTGTITKTSAGAAGGYTSSSILNVGSGWYRITLTGFATGTTPIVSIAINSSATPTYGNYGFETWTAAGTETIVLWGAQLEQRSSVTAYTPTTTAAITNYIPALQTAASGVPRFDHTPTTGESLGLLIEEQRTNLSLYSEQFDNSYWFKNNWTSLTNSAVAPDGTLTADKFVETTATGFHSTYTNSSVGTLTGTYTMSVYLKAAGRNWAIVRFNGTSNWFDLANGVVGTVGAGYTTSITSVGNGWYRCAVTLTVSAFATFPEIFVTTANNVASYTGDGFSGIYVWGAQLEAGAFATSYIPTVASQVTRSPDAASMTGTNFSSWYRADEGTMYTEALVVAQQNSSGNTMTYLGISDNTINNRIRLKTAVFAEGVFQGSTSGTTQFELGSAPTINIFNKFAGAYKTNDFAFSQNGGTASTDTLGTIPSVTQMQIGNLLTSRELTGTIKKLAFYPKRLTNQELTALTTV